ncbi:MAG TPA: prolyl oligopeptidase family serine peptidase [Sedimentisphaerales bacterium]|nr:prolyl oligopeptidase family serine peptidase [Sedimentisphaerales bacterium]
MRFFKSTVLGLTVLGGIYGMTERSMAAGGQSEQVFQKQITKTVELKYLLHLPTGYGDNQDQKWPVMLFLHGAGERGSDLNKVKVHGPPKLIEQGKDLPFIVVSPQCPAGTWWTEQLDALTALLDDVQTRYAVDVNRVYLTGLSMGGFGSWALGCRYPNRFAAIVPICGGGEWFLAERLKNVPVWAFHGAKDSVVPLRQSQEMVDALKRAGGNVQLTVYPEANHDSWTETYNNPKLYEWLLSQRKGGEAK